MLGGSEPPRRRVLEDNALLTRWGSSEGKLDSIHKHDFLRARKPAALGGREVRLHGPCVCVYACACSNSVPQAASLAVRCEELQGSEPTAERP